MPKFSEIPQLIHANYRINLPWDHLRFSLDKYKEDYGLNLDPDFQRGHVWDDSKRIAYVEYIMRGGTSSRELQFNCYYWDTRKGVKEGPVVLVDGKQRLNSVLMFLNNELKAFGSYRKEYIDRCGLTGPQFILFMNNLETRKEVLEWYLQLNSGGVVHTQEELDKVKKLLEKENEKES